MNQGIILDDFNIVLELDDDGVYTPSMYKDGKDWLYIGEGDIIRDWMLYVKIAFSNFDKVTKEKTIGNLYSYQWGFSLRAILMVMAFNAETLDVEWSRQLS